MPTCPSCSYPVDEDTNFCTYCSAPNPTYVASPVVETDMIANRTRKRVLRVLAIVIGVIAGLDLVITIIPRPDPPQRLVLGPGVVSQSSYSETDTSVIAAKNWIQAYLNPVGWVAVSMGYGPSTLYQLRRKEGWGSALEMGQILTLLALLILPPVLWIRSSRTKRNSPRHEDTGSS